MLVFFGFAATVGSAYVQIERVPGAAWWGSLAVGLLACAILLANNVRDVADRPRRGQAHARGPPRRARRPAALRRVRRGRVRRRRRDRGHAAVGVRGAGRASPLAIRARPAGPAPAPTRRRSSGRSSPRRASRSWSRCCSGPGCACPDRAPPPHRRPDDHAARGPGGMGRVLAACPATRATPRRRAGPPLEAAVDGWPAPAARRRRGQRARDASPGSSPGALRGVRVREGEGRVPRRRRPGRRRARRDRPARGAARRRQRRVGRRDGRRRASAARALRPRAGRAAGRRRSRSSRPLRRRVGVAIAADECVRSVDGRAARSRAARRRRRGRAEGAAARRRAGRARDRRGCRRAGDPHVDDGDVGRLAAGLALAAALPELPLRVRPRDGARCSPPT